MLINMSEMCTCQLYYILFCEIGLGKNVAVYQGTGQYTLGLPED